MTGGQDFIIGIDLGTTNSVVAALEGDRPIVIPNSEGANCTPSVVAFQDNGDALIGKLAERQGAVNALRTITSIKRLMGRFYSDLEDHELQRTFKIVDDNDEILIDIDGHGYTPPQMSALILAKLKRDAENYLGGPVSRAVITVPAYFDDLQREATLEAGNLAGLNVLRLISEPTAAAMAYGLGREGHEVVAIYDFGGGTFDMSLLEVDRNTFEVLATHGDTQLGGDDIDLLLLEDVCQTFKTQHGIDIQSDPMHIHRLMEAVEQAKCDLSAMQMARINLPFIAVKDQQPIHLDYTITRDQFETMIEPLVDRTIRVCKQTLMEAGIKRNDIHKVILVGGSSRIPLVQEMVAEYFDQDPYKGVNPDEVVALGAAMQAGVFEGKLEEVVLMEITPHSLGIEVVGGRMSPIIEKNSTIPIKAAKIFTTTEDEQEFVAVHVLQGESENAAENRSLGKFILSNLRQVSKGIPRIHVTFFINSDGIVEISARDVESGAEESLSVVHSHLDEAEKRERRRRRPKDPRRRRRPSQEDRLAPQALGVGGKPIDPSDTSENPAQPSFQEIVAEGISGASSDMRLAARAMSSELRDTRPRPLRGDSTGVVLASPTAPAAENVSADAPPDSVAAQAEPVAPTDTAPPGKEPPAAIAAEDAEPGPVAAAEASLRIHQAVEALEEGRADAETLSLYREALEDLADSLESAIAEKLPTDWAIEAMCRMHVLLQQPDAAMAVLRRGRDEALVSAEQRLACCEGLLQRFPKYAPALAERASILARQGDYDQAIASAELALESELTNTQWVDMLEKLYQESISQQPDATQEFKLVKIFLRKDKVDEAIDVLQRLVQKPAYARKALKILGLCFWQKNMYYMAWQKFKQLDLNEEIKDIIYRLSVDMENDNQLSNARQVLDHLSARDPNYRETRARLERIQYQMKLQEGDPDGKQSPEFAAVLNHPRFIILEEINRGSMGVIYRARDVVLNEVVALKLLNDYLCADPLAVERFKTEARAARKLTHANIVRIHDFFESDAKKFISMEFIQGKDLKHVLATEGPLAADRVASICATVARALDYAHSRSVIHRDVKPANIMIGQDHDIRITDLGIAKLIQADDSTLSASIVMGTPLYMSPEQIQGGGIDARVDVYALGIVMYELLTGRPPFYEGNVEYHHVNTPPPSLPESAPAELAEIIVKAIQKDRTKRFQSAIELAENLEQFLRDSTM